MLTVVTGPPAAGKTTWVRDHAGPDDIVIDYDTLAAALSGPGAHSHQHPRALQQVTHRARQAAIFEAFKHCGKVDVYIIHSMPSDTVMARYLQYGAHVVTIDPGRDVVTERLARLRSTEARKVADRWYARARRAHPAPTATEARTSRTW